MEPRCRSGACSLSPWSGGGAGFGQAESPAQRSLLCSFSGAMRNDRQQQTCMENLLASPASFAKQGAWVGHDKRRHWTSVALSSPHSPDCAVGAIHHPGEEEVSSGMNTIFPSSRLSNARSVSPSVHLKPDHGGVRPVFFSFGQCRFAVIFAVTIATLTAGVTSSFFLDGAAADHTASFGRATFFLFVEGPRSRQRDNLCPRSLVRCPVSPGQFPELGIGVIFVPKTGSTVTHDNLWLLVARLAALASSISTSHPPQYPHRLLPFCNSDKDSPLALHVPIDRCYKPS